jgi:hypothetical protein
VTASAANSFLPNVRVTGNFTRSASGEPAIIGEPLLKYRFPLSRLAGIGRTGPNTSGNTTLDNGIASSASASTIRRDFGIVWDSVNGCWNYVRAVGLSPVVSTIHNLNDVLYTMCILCYYDTSININNHELLYICILSDALFYLERYC